jgi:predicted NAD-dependent protein-ADP-ribosyltransferase YbiA (DUF1768 family)
MKWSTLAICAGIISFTSSSFAQLDSRKGGCAYLKRDRPSIYISFDRQIMVKEKGSDVRETFLRLHNNSTCSISVETYPDETPNEKKVSRRPNGDTVTTSTPIFYDFKESKGEEWKPANYRADRAVFNPYRIPAGHSAAFEVADEAFRKELPISVPFEFSWEDNVDLGLWKTISHRVSYDYDLQTGFYENESSLRKTYTSIWFAPINDPKKPDWEILPQEAKAGEVILSKRNELGILSNFAATPFVLDGKRYASVEGFWQMMLYPEGPDDERAKAKGVEWKFTREQVAQMTAFEAKSAGTLAEENMKKLGIDWCTYQGKRFPYRSATPGEHYRLIVAAMRAKLEQNPEVKRILVATGDLILKPDHHGEENPPPEWKYYEIWMQLRSELQK